MEKADHESPHLLSYSNRKLRELEIGSVEECKYVSLKETWGAVYFDLIIAICNIFESENIFVVIDKWNGCVKNDRNRCIHV